MSRKLVAYFSASGVTAMDKCCTPEIEPDEIDVADTVAFTWEIK